MQQLVVTGLQGKREILNVAKTCTIDQLFTEVIGKCTSGISAEELRLVYAGSELERGKGHTIATYDIPPMGQLFMVIRLRGGLLGAGIWLPLPLRIGSLICGDSVPTTYDPDVLTFDNDYSSARLCMPCGHAIGAEALIGYCTNLVDAGKLGFPCPACSYEWSYAFIRKALKVKGQSVVYLDCKVMENSFRVIPGFQKCPGRCCGDLWLFLDPAESASVNCVRCPLCHQVFCWSFLRQGTSMGSHCGYSDCPNGTDPRIRFLETQPVKTIGSVSGCPSVRGCPRCGTLVEHRDACKHMVCKSCNLQFCFVCLNLFNVVSGQWPCGSHAAACPVAPRQSTLPRLQ